MDIAFQWCWSNIIFVLRPDTSYNKKNIYLEKGNVFVVHTFNLCDKTYGLQKHSLFPSNQWFIWLAIRRVWSPDGVELMQISPACKVNGNTNTVVWSVVILRFYYKSFVTVQAQRLNKETTLVVVNTCQIWRQNLFKIIPINLCRQIIWLRKRWRDMHKSLSKDTPYSPVKAMYGVSFVSANLIDVLSL